MYMHVCCVCGAQALIVAVAREQRPLDVANLVSSCHVVLGQISHSSLELKRNYDVGRNKGTGEPMLSEMRAAVDGSHCVRRWLS